MPLINMQLLHTSLRKQEQATKNLLRLLRIDGNGKLCVASLTGKHRHRIKHWSRVANRWHKKLVADVVRRSSI